jgi:3-hydroxyacyl-CoA dehydrogenase
MTVKQVAVVGAGTMGPGIARVCATSRYGIHFVDVVSERTQKALKVIEQSLRKFAKRRGSQRKFSSFHLLSWTKLGTQYGKPACKRLSSHILCFPQSWS